jgi:nucleoside-diphosphate-sugar epimerase
MTAAAVSANPLAEDLAHVLAHTDARVWEALRDQNIFVTGGTGFFGRWLLESFAHANPTLDLNARLVVLSRDPVRFLATAPHLGADVGISFVRGDVQDFTTQSVREALGESGPERFGFVVHAATEASAKLNAENPLLMIDTIVQGTRAALEFAVASGASRFLLTSSGAVYGPQPPDVTHVAEDYLGGPDQTNVGSAYGEGKRLAELLCVCFAKQHGLEPVLARCFAFVGPFLPLDAHFAIGNFIRDAIRGGPIRVGGDGTPYRSYLYAADLVIWLWTMLVKAESCRAYNVGSSQDLDIAAIAEQVRSAVAPNAAVEIARQPQPDAPPSRYVPSTLRAERELLLHTLVPLPEAIRRTADHARNHLGGGAY